MRLRRFSNRLPLRYAASTSDLDRVRERHLCNLTREARLFAAPIAEARPKTVRGCVDLSPPQKLRQVTCRKVVSRDLSVTGTEIRHRDIDPVPRFTISIARAESGTTCSRPPFIRSAGIIQSAFCEVEFVLRRQTHLATARRVENEKLERQPGDLGSLRLSQLRDKLWHISIRQSGEVLRLVGLFRQAEDRPIDTGFHRFAFRPRCRSR